MPALTAATRSAAIAAACVQVLLLSACDDRSVMATSFQADAVPSLGLQEELRLGSVDNPDLGFSRIGTVDVDRDGRSFVFEALDLHFRVYDTDGRELYRFGRRGQGPGEFQLSPNWGVLGDTVWTIDLIQRRLTLFDREGRVLSTGSYEQVPVRLWESVTTIPMVTPSALRGDGMFIGHLTSFGSPTNAPALPSGESPPENESVMVPRIRFDASGAVIDTVGWYPYLPTPGAAGQTPRYVTFSDIRYTLPTPPGDQPISVAVDDGHIFVERPIAEAADHGVFRVTRIGLAGDTTYSREFGYRPVPYSSEALDAIAWRRVPIPTGSYLASTGPPPMPPDSMARFRVVRDALDFFPAYQPPVRAHRIGSDGALWLLREDLDGQTARWLVLDPDGLPVGTLVLPNPYRVAWSDGNLAWIVQPDEYEVQWLVRYRIE